jgi:hypothetical protein
MASLGNILRAVSSKVRTTTPNNQSISAEDDDVNVPEAVSPTEMPKKERALDTSATKKERALDTSATKLNEDAVRRAAEAKARTDVLKDIANEREREEAEASDEDEVDAISSLGLQQVIMMLCC